MFFQGPERLSRRLFEFVRLYGPASLSPANTNQFWFKDFGSRTKQKRSLSHSFAMPHKIHAVYHDSDANPRIFRGQHRGI